MLLWVDIPFVHLSRGRRPTSATCLGLPLRTAPLEARRAPRRASRPSRPRRTNPGRGGKIPPRVPRTRKGRRTLRGGSRPGRAVRASPIACRCLSGKQTTKPRFHLLAVPLRVINLYLPSNQEDLPACRPPRPAKLANTARGRRRITRYRGPKAMAVVGRCRCTACRPLLRRVPRYRRARQRAKALRYPLAWSPLPAPHRTRPTHPRRPRCPCPPIDPDTSGKARSTTSCQSTRASRRQCPARSRPSRNRPLPPSLQGCANPQPMQARPLRLNLGR